jgi:hypothetical protein
METSRIIYLIFLFVSLFLSIYCKKSEKGLYIFPFLIGIALFTELLSSVLKHYGFNTFPVYHVYIPVEYALWVIYFRYLNQKVLIKKLMLLSIPVFYVFCIISSLFINTINQFPSVHINIEALLLITWATYTIFNIEVNENFGITERPVFWICVAVLIFYSLVSPFLGVYNLIHKFKDEIQFYLLNIPNYILYTSLSIAFLCSHRIKKLL